MLRVHPIFQPCSGRLWTKAILSPLRSIVPNLWQVLSLTFTSAASSKTKFMYSSKPRMTPSILLFLTLLSQIWTRFWFCKNRNNKFMGWTIIFWILPLLCDMVTDVVDLLELKSQTLKSNCPKSFTWHSYPQQTIR